MSNRKDISLSSGHVLVGDCVERMRKLPDASVDAIVTDPPYELGFMGKAWDGAGIAYSVMMWQECLRVLKPGGHLLAFGGTRTYHRMACAIEDAGFEIRDSIHWVYGSGFPKSLDVSKAIDKAAGAKRKVVGINPNVVRDSKVDGGSDFGGFTKADPSITAPATDEARRWEGWGTALKPAHEPIVVARKPLVGTVAATVLEHGTGALNIDGCRVGTEKITINGQGNDNLFHGKFSGKIENSERVGRFPANVVFDRAAGKALDQQSGPRGAAAPASGPTYSGPSKSGSMAGEFKGNGDKPPAFHDDKGGASRFFTQADFGPDDWPFVYQAKPSRRERNAGLDGLPDKLKPYGNREPEDVPEEGDRPGSVNDKFTTRPAANHHPTVKPVALMRHLVRLVTPPGGTVLDPFLGSGTTAVAAILEGFNWAGCEMTDEYLPIIRGRVEWAEKEVAKRAKQPTLGEEA